MIGDQALWRASLSRRLVNFGLISNGNVTRTIVPGYDGRHDAKRFVVNVRGLVEHDQIVVPLLRGEDAFAMVDEPVQFGACCNDLAKSRVEH